MRTIQFGPLTLKEKNGDWKTKCMYFTLRAVMVLTKLP